MAVVTDGSVDLVVAAIAHVVTDTSVKQVLFVVALSTGHLFPCLTSYRVVLVVQTTHQHCRNAAAKITVPCLCRVAAIIGLHFTIHDSKKILRVMPSLQRDHFCALSVVV